MKRNTWLLLLLLSALGVESQVMYPYTFSKSSATYSNLIGSINLTSGKRWDDTLMTIPLGFNFKWALGNRNIDSIVIDTDGILYAPQDFNSSTDNPIRSMMPYEADMTDRGFNNSSAAVSPISYLTTGVAGSRICKIEFRNAGFYNDITTNDFINFQIWLYESTNIIEYRYGASNVANIPLSFDGRNGPYINLLYKTTVNIGTLSIILDTCTYITGNSGTASAVYSNSPIDYLNNPPANFGFSGLPADGQVFRFAPFGSSVSVPEIEDAFRNVVVYPTFIQDAVFINHDENNLSASIIDIYGRVVIKECNLKSNLPLNTSMLHQGLYFLTLSNDQSHTKTYQLIK